MVDPAVVQNNVDFLGWLKVGSVFRSDSEDICVTSSLTVFDTKLLTSIPVFKCHTANCLKMEHFRIPGIKLSLTGDYYITQAISPLNVLLKMQSLWSCFFLFLAHVASLQDVGKK